MSDTKHVTMCVCYDSIYETVIVFNLFNK